MAGAVGVEPTRADLESAILAVRPHPENETTLLDTNSSSYPRFVKFAVCV